MATQRRRKILTMILSAVMLLTLVACSDTNSGNVRQNEPSAPPQTESTPKAESTPNNAPSESDELSQKNKILVVYFSATGNTKVLAEYAADILNADIYEIQPEEPYTTADLNYNDSSSRSSKEQNDSSSLPAFIGSVEDMEGYDVVLLGYPIWWGQAPKIIHAFLESYDFSGKTIVPFCTSGSSGVGSSAVNLKGLCDDSAVWLDATRLNSGASKNDVETWINGLGLGLNESEVRNMASITLTVDDAVLTATMLDTPAVRDFQSSLPLTLTLEDYNSTEKISGLPNKLSNEDAPSGYDPSVGDICYYAPWGNLCIFYKDFGYSSGLIPLGHIDSGIETLANITSDFTVTFDIAN